MKTMSLIVLLGTTGLTLAACGSSGGDAAFDSFQDDIALSNAIEDGELAGVDTSTRTGTATMTGAIGIGDLGDDEELELIGELSVQADFDSDTASGSASNFGIYEEDTGRLAEDGQVSGSLTMSNGTISGQDFDADMNGRLTNAGDDFDLGLALDGKFYDRGGDLVVGGDVTGTITDVGSLDVQNVEGGFVASE